MVYYFSPQLLYVYWWCPDQLLESNLVWLAKLLIQFHNIFSKCLCLIFCSGLWGYKDSYASGGENIDVEVLIPFRFFIFKYELHLKNSHHLIISLCNCVCFLRFVNCDLSNCLATRQSTCLKAEARIPVALGCFDGFICYTFGLPWQTHLLILIFYHQVYLCICLITV